MANRRKSRRAQLIEMSGGACVKCGSKEELHFDHKDPKKRSFRLNGRALDGSWEKILKEWAKCQLLCRLCHLQKTKEDGYAPAWNKGKSKYGETLPEHGCEASYAHGCRCDECSKAKHDARVRRGELKGTRGRRGPNGVLRSIKHGTRAGYTAEKRRGLPVCEECRKANAEATRNYKQAKKLACGEMASCSAVTGMFSVRVGVGQPKI
jgi:hypothetical protein